MPTLFFAYLCLLFFLLTCAYSFFCLLVPTLFFAYLCLLFFLLTCAYSFFCLLVPTLFFAYLCLLFFFLLTCAYSFFLLTCAYSFFFCLLVPTLFFFAYLCLLFFFTYLCLLFFFLLTFFFDFYRPYFQMCYNLQMMQFKNLAHIAKKNVQPTTNPLNLHQVCYQHITSWLPVYDNLHMFMGVLFQSLIFYHNRIWPILWTHCMVGNYSQIGKQTVICKNGNYQQENIFVSHKDLKKLNLCLIPTITPMCFDYQLSLSILSFK